MQPKATTCKAKVVFDFVNVPVFVCLL